MGGSSDQGGVMELSLKSEFSVKGSLAANEANCLPKILRVKGIVLKAKFSKRSVIFQHS